MHTKTIMPTNISIKMMQTNIHYSCRKILRQETSIKYAIGMVEHISSVEKKLVDFVEENSVHIKRRIERKNRP